MHAQVCGVHMWESRLHTPGGKRLGLCLGACVCVCAYACIYTHVLKSTGRTSGGKECTNSRILYVHSSVSVGSAPFPLWNSRTRAVVGFLCSVQVACSFSSYSFSRWFHLGSSKNVTVMLSTFICRVCAGKTNLHHEAWSSDVPDRPQDNCTILYCTV